MADHVKWCNICKTPPQAEKIKEFEKVLPPGYTHLLCLVEEEESRAFLKVKLSSKEDANKWLRDFQLSSTLTWRVARTYPTSGRYNTYRVDFRCQHKTYASGPKDTNCPATLILVLKRSVGNRKSRSTDRHMAEGYFLYLNWRNNHNHLLSCTEALRKRDVSATTVERLTELFQQGHSPSSALETIKYDLQEKEGEGYFLVAADRSIVPDPQFCYRLYNKIFAQCYGAPSGEKMAADLKARIEGINLEHGVMCAEMRAVEGQLLVAICTPLMQRVHSKVQQSGEIVFVDSSGHCDRENHHIFLLMTHSAAGGLPLGVLITTSENTATLQAGFALVKSLLPPGAFFGRGDDGPQIIMTGDCAALHQALHASYPGATLLLCTFHILQALWRWLWSSHNGIEKQDRPQLLNGFRQLVDASTENELSAKYSKLSGGILAQKYPNFQKYLAGVYRRREEWALSLRQQHNNTNNFVERAMKIVKDNILHRLKAYNVTQLVDFIITRFEAYYIRRLTDFANNHVSSCQPRPPNCSDVDCQRIIQEDETNFMVASTSGTTWYAVNTALSCCTCPIGVTGAHCKHQNAVEQTFNVTEAIPASSTPHLRRLFLEVALGRTTPEKWFESLASQKPVVEQEQYGHCGDGDAAGTIPTILEKAAGTAPTISGDLHCDHFGTGDPLPHQRDVAEAACSPDVGTSASDTEVLERRLCDFYDHLKQKLRGDESFRAPVKAFLDTFSKLHTDTAVQSALFSFGKSPQAPPKGQVVSRGFLQTSTKIGVQPSVLSRRVTKKSAMGGRNDFGAGRPSECLRKEHGYHKQERAKPAPHNISFCVQENSVLGKTH